MSLYDIAIIGGGLAGLTASIDLSRKGYRVVLFEREDYPRHKVCGEYISNEIVGYFTQIGITLNDAIPINRVQISNVTGNKVEVPLPLGGIGYSRYALDAHLYRCALNVNVEVLHAEVTSVNFVGDYFNVNLANKRCFRAKIAIGAFGKRSVLDKKLNRKFLSRKAPWLGVKAHYTLEDYPDDLVGIHNFKGGYGGLSKVETGSVNFCYLASYASFKKFKNIAKYNQAVVRQNPILKEFLSKAEPVFEKPISIAQISFAKKKAVEDHILMCGDTAGLIHPLCGNGMAMAIHSAKIASDKIHTFLSRATYSREQLEIDYQTEWDKQFSVRLATGRILQRYFTMPLVTGAFLPLAKNFPKLLNSIISKTHGNPIQI